MSKTRKERLTRIGLYLAYAVITLFFVFPIFWVLSTSLKSVPQLFASPPIWFPTDPAFGNYSHVFNNTPTLRYLLNSALLVSLTVFFTVLIAVLAAYGFSRYTFRFKRPSLLAVLAFQMISPVVIAIPLYRLGGLLCGRAAVYDLVPERVLRHHPLPDGRSRDSRRRLPLADPIKDTPAG
jgi:multiple sugar transport system permease protein